LEKIADILHAKSSDTGPNNRVIKFQVNKIPGTTRLMHQRHAGPTDGRTDGQTSYSWQYRYT